MKVSDINKKHKMGQKEIGTFVLKGKCVKCVITDCFLKNQKIEVPINEQSIYSLCGNFVWKYKIIIFSLHKYHSYIPCLQTLSFSCFLVVLVALQFWCCHRVSGHPVVCVWDCSAHTFLSTQTAGTEQWTHTDTTCVSADTLLPSILILVIK